MSSANILAIALTESGRSSTYNKDSNGPRIEPCGRNPTSDIFP